MVLATLVVAALFSMPPAPGAGLGLAPGPERASSRPFLPITVPALPMGVAIGIGGIAVLAGARPRPRGRGPTEDPLFVFVPGHGGSGADFADLIGAMGIGREQAALFDYRWAYPATDPELAAQRALTTDAADALAVAVGVLAREHPNIYLVGHSKGGAVLTELIARWDADPGLGVAAVRGAALLDPAIASGGLGDLQRVGYWLDGIADNGRFDPIRCGWLTCTDVRANLGEEAGVEVIAIRNPDALVTNFADEPEGLRIYDLDDGPHPLDRPWDILSVLSRIRQAHASVLHSDAVAACIMAEAARSGSCLWPGGAAGGPRGSGRSGGGPIMV